VLAFCVSAVLRVAQYFTDTHEFQLPRNPFSSAASASSVSFHRACLGLDLHFKSRRQGLREIACLSIAYLTAALARTIETHGPAALPWPD
jgi:hypothetical protein